MELCALDGQTFYKQQEEDECQHHHRAPPVLRLGTERKLQGKATNTAQVE